MQVRDLVQISADQVQIVQIFHPQILDHFQPNFLRQLGPACCTLKILGLAVIFYFEFSRFTLDMSSIWWILFKWIAEADEVFFIEIDKDNNVTISKQINKLT